LKTDIQFTKKESQTISLMIFGGLALMILCILPIGSSDPDVNFILIIVNIFYWAMTMILINSSLHNVLMRKIEGSQSHDSVKRES
jgi:hypothetical protein